MDDQRDILLVHGTWARGGKWSRSDSSLSRQLKAEVANTNTVAPFDWSGANRFSARLKAGWQLGEALAKAPDDRKVVVCAHSHGGSVLCYALRQRPELAQRISAMVFLSTPFYTCRLLPSWRVLFDGLSSFLVLALLALLLVVSNVAAAFIMEIDLVVSMVISAIVATELMLAVLIAINKAKLVVAHRLLRRAIDVGRKVSCELPADANAVFVRLSGDEAGAVLSVTQAMAWLIISLNVIFARAAGYIIKPFRVVRIHHPYLVRLVLYPVMAFLVYGSSEFFNDLSRIPGGGDGISFGGAWSAPVRDPFAIWSGEIAAFTGVVLVVIAGVLALMFLLSAALLLLNWLLSLPFGAMPVYLGGIVQPAVEVTPPGQWTIIHASWRSYGRQLRKPLWRHSNPYSEPTVVAAIIGWLKSGGGR